MPILPLVFGIFMAIGGFPAGLFVYWIANNSITFVQNVLIYVPFQGNAGAARQATKVLVPRNGGIVYPEGD